MTGRQPGSVRKVITTLEFLSGCSSAIREILSYWDRIRGSRRMPSPADFDFADVAGHMPGILVVDVLGDPPDFVYRLVGAREVEARGYDPTGKRVSEHWFGGHSAEVALGNYGYAATQGSFLYDYERYAERTGRYETDESLFLPLSSDGKVVTQIVVYTHYDDIWRKTR
jgi:hypothetical protein